MKAGLDPEKIAAAARVGLRSLGSAPGEWRGTVSVRQVTESTNDDARAMGVAGAPDGSAVFAEEQRAGRGRRQRRWSAPPARNLTFSVVVRTELAPDAWPRMGHAAALAVARAVDPWLAPLRAEIKWPNDIYVDGRKLGGILVEAHPRKTGPFLVVGIGLNVNSRPEEFAGEGLEQEITSLVALQRSGELDRNEVGGAVLAELWHQVRRAEHDFPAVLDQLRRRSWVLGKPVQVWRGEEVVRGWAVDLGANGELLVRDGPDGGVRAIVSADRLRVVEG